MKHKGPSPVTTGTDLTLLLSAEQDLESLLATARAEARALVDRANAASTAAATQLELELASAEAGFRHEVETERDRRAAEVLADGRRQAAAYDAVPPERIEALADLALARLLSGIRP
jgi:vacuolar-type H+-ATPase subunit H